MESNKVSSEERSRKVPDSCDSEYGACLPLREVAMFWDRVARDRSQDSCWAWTGAKLPTGYGFITRNTKIDGKWKGQTIYAHRLSYMIHNGEIPEDKWVLHRCDNPNCVNPKHLKLGTHQDNMDDMNDKGRHPTIPRKIDPSEIPAMVRGKFDPTL